MNVDFSVMEYFPGIKKEVSSRSVQIVSYDPQWPKIFEEKAPRIKEALGENCVDVHHFGSTSVAGLSAKPKVDILAVVKSFASLHVPRLVEIGYEVRNDPIPTGKYFVRVSPRVHLHVFEEGNPLIARNLEFRDWLRSHPDDRAAYAALKQTFAGQYGEDNGMAYCYAKTEFIEGVIAKAARERPNSKCE
jgi:GrpB-like predicted nucleotidyltransferase (UPF0157 family)